MYSVLEADCPWKFGDSLPGKSRGASNNYQCMGVADLMRFPLPPLAPDAVLFLWRVSSMQQEALDVVKAWGFTLKSEIVWEKLTSTGLPHFGMGRYVRASHETCLVATRGRWKPRVRNVRSRFAAKVGRHSQKPDEFYELVERLTVGPRARLFARSERDGWDSFGDQLPGCLPPNQPSPLDLVSVA
jgi:N6-adenosine-specific RNA methylase IME4